MALYKLRNHEIVSRLLRGEPFYLYGLQYRFLPGPAHDGIYHYQLQDERGKRAGAAIIFEDKRPQYIRFAFHWGKENVLIKDFEPAGAKIYQAYEPGQSS